MPMTLSLMRRTVLAMTILLAAPVALTQPAAAANVAESFVGDNIHKGLEILNNKKINTVQRRDQFETFLLGLVDVRRIGLFTLGQYRRSAPPDDVDAFIAAFKNYAVAAYQSYFARYSGQTLTVTGSTERSPTDFIVQTQLIDPNSNQQRWKWISGSAPIPASRCWWTSRCRASGCRWRNATSSPPSWARITAMCAP